MHADQDCLKLTMPLAPLVQEGSDEPASTMRVGRDRCLDYDFVLAQFGPNTLVEIEAGGVPHAVTSVLSPYSRDFHLLTIRTDKRWCGYPAVYSPEAGRVITELGGFALGVVCDEGDIANWGYNSSSYYYASDGYACFASLPSLWHPQVWKWDAPPREEKRTKYAEWVAASSLSPIQQRALIANDYGEPFAEWCWDKIRDQFSSNTLFHSVFCGEPEVTCRGLILRFRPELHELIMLPGFFNDVLVPLDKLLHQGMCVIHSSLMEIDFGYLDSMLCSCEEVDIAKLCSIPSLRSKTETKALFRTNGLPPELLEAIWPFAENYCLDHGEQTDRLIPGGGYSVIFSKQIGNEAAGTCVIMPGFPQGPGGVVEALGVLLVRPSYQLSREELLERSRKLYPLGQQIAERYGAL